MGKVFEVRVDLTRQGPKQYESDKIGLSATPDEGEDVAKLISDMKAVIVGEARDLKGGTTVIEEKVEVVKEKKPTKAEPPVSKEKPQEKGKDEPKQELKQETAKEDPAQEAAKEEPKEEKKARKPETERKPRSSGKTTVYDRSLDTHKALLGSFLDEKLGKTWRAGAVLKKAGAASQKLNDAKIDFLDGDGNMLESFKEAFLKAMEK